MAKLWPKGYLKQDKDNIGNSTGLKRHMKMTFCKNKSTVFCVLEILPSQYDDIRRDAAKSGKSSDNWAHFSIKPEKTLISGNGKKLNKAIRRFEFVSCVMPGTNEICNVRWFLRPGSSWFFFCRVCCLLVAVFRVAVLWTCYGRDFCQLLCNSPP